ncbi:PLP-dependent cysteine synthase family protein [Microbacterium sp. UBA6741]|uniref:PLP-dependent cysteine synthase family protein n=1 Tax=Microbacterium sp. UBA6741 TaxID=1946952 RepID=UPI0025E96697|nr:PLP-dependent cysteine synthase family protein [Microbacterium sp. UBA6741]
MSDWTSTAIALLEADANRSADTHLHLFPLPPEWGIDLYLKDESVHPTGSLKHRLARSLILYGLVNGRIREDTTLVESSSGSTAVSEAYFARMLGLPFITVVPRSTVQEKIDLIEFYGGTCHFVDRAEDMSPEAQRLASDCTGHYLDQFTFAERATDWRGNNNIAESIFRQMEREPHPVPAWMVMSAGTGGTSATLGRYLRYKRHATRLCVADVEHSAFFDGYRTADAECRCERASQIEGVGRPRVEPSFVPGVIDRMVRVPDAASIAAMNVLSRRLGRRVGGSTGTNFFALCWLAAEMKASGRQGSLVTLICDSGERYLKTYYDPAWLAEKGLDPAPYESLVEAVLAGGSFELPLEEA